jgi:RHH-type proline utilization regulon transcriptional repressor/proline dehydrogenase/delta 1-pyrroline-5-carboxylate dehydrogenase
VAANSNSHVTVLFGPVLSVMRADDFEHAIELANATPYGLTAGLFTLDEREQSRWVSRMKAGNLYINRSTTGAIVGRQPFGGWKASGFGPSAKAGGPNYPLQLSHWADATQPQPRPTNPPDPTAAALLSVVRGRIEPAARERLASAACHYAQALSRHFQLLHDPSALLGESNLFRYLPFLRLTVRCHADASLSECLLASLAAVTAGVAPVLSLHPELKWSLPELPGCTIVVEDDQALAERIRAGAVERVRQIGSLPGELRAHAADSGVYIATGAVLLAGRLELLHYLREQVVSNAYHRYGSLHGAQLRPLQAAARG